MLVFLMPCWYSYSDDSNRYIFEQGDMTCLRSSKRSLKPSKTKYPLGKHPNNLMPYKIIPRYGLRAECPSCKSRLYASRAGHLSAWLFHVLACCAIIAAATANGRRLSNKIPTKLVFHWSSLAELPVTLLYISKKSQQKSSPGMGVVPTIMLKRY